MSSILEWTGERMVPEATQDDVFWEHIRRYQFATTFVRANRVLDIACGEGYGSAALLHAGAASLVGVDISEAAVNHARAKYGIDARLGSAELIPAPDKSFDLVVSFETIEHVPHPERFVKEVRRVLTPGGLFLVSTPNKEIKSPADLQNPFHCSEMTRKDFTSLLRQHFGEVSLRQQRCSHSRYDELVNSLETTLGIRRIRGREKVRLLLQRMFLKQTRPSADAPLTALMELVQQPPSLFASFVDRFAIRRWEEKQVGQPHYFLAIAR